MNNQEFYRTAPYKAMGDYIKEVMKEKDVTLNQLAASTGLSRTTISFILTGQHRLGQASMVAIATVLGVPAANLLDKIPPEFLSIMREASPREIAKAKSMTLLPKQERYPRTNIIRRRNRTAKNGDSRSQLVHALGAVITSLSKEDLTNLGEVLNNAQR